jgi:hypothetical protein
MELQALYRELLAAGYSPAEIPSIIQRLAQSAEQQRQRLLSLGYPQTYVSALSGPQLFGTTGLPVVTGQYEIDREAQARRDLETALGTRAAAGGGLLDFYRNLYAEVDAASRSPFNYTDYLRNYRDLPAGTGDPVQSLLSEGKYIEPKLPTIFQDRRVRDLLDTLGDYARSIRNVRGNARGGTMMLEEPVVGVGAFSGRPHFTAAENGPERLRFEPLRGVKRGLPRQRQRTIIDMGLRNAPATPPNDFPFPPRDEAPRVPGYAAGGVYGFNSAEDARKFRDAIKNATPAQLAALSGMAGGTGQLFDRGSGGAAKPVQERDDAWLRSQYGFTDKFMTEPRFAGWRERIRTYGPAGLSPFAKREELARVGAFKGYDTYGNEVYENAWRPSRHRRGRDSSFWLNDGTKMTTTGYLGPHTRGGSFRVAGVPSPSGNGSSGSGSSGSGGQALSERQALADMLYNALKNVSYVHPDMLAALQRHEAPPPSTLTQRFLANVDPEIFDLLFGSLYPAYGFRNRQSLLQSARQYHVPGLATTTRR